MTSEHDHPSNAVPASRQPNTSETPDAAPNGSPLGVHDDDEGARLLAELGVSEGPRPDIAVDAAPDNTDDEAHITPARFVRYALGRHDRTLEASLLPETLIATFQRAVFTDLVAATSASQPPQVPEDVARVMQGAVGERQVALVRLGIGAPATVTVLEELIALGVKRIIVIGTGGSLQRSLPIGSLTIATGAIREDGTSFHYAPAGVEVAPDAALSRALGEAVVALGSQVAFGPMWTTDAPYRELQSKVAVYSAMGALAVEMEAAALFALASFRQVQAALLLAISDELFHEWRPGFHAEELRLAQRIATQAALSVATADA
ncbi:MAG TPA: nucleoside phosphorylase [Ktedonobacterales bacterium]